jgi:hypothetical protein
MLFIKSGKHWHATNLGDFLGGDNWPFCGFRSSFQSLSSRLMPAALHWMDKIAYITRHLKAVADEGSH